MSKEFKKYGIAHSKRPRSHPLLSATVAVSKVADGKEERFYCYITFTEALVDAVAKRLPRGLRKEDPGYLHVVILGTGFKVFAVYSSGASRVELWAGEGTPTRVRLHRVQV